MMLAVAMVAAAALQSSELINLCKGELRPGSYLLKGPASAQLIQDACASLESQATKPAFPRDLMAIDGTWKLVYSATLALPTPPVEGAPEALFGALESFPLAPKTVEQKLDVVNRRCVNVVSLAPWPPQDFLGGALSLLPGPLGGALETLARSSVRLELDHAFSVEGEGGSSGGRRVAAAGSVVDLNLEEVRRTLSEDTGASGEEEPWVDMLNPAVRKQQQRQQESASGNLLMDLIPRESTIELGPLSALAAGSFETVFCDGDVRISRGTGVLSSELRVFERIGTPAAKVYDSWQEEEDALAAQAAAGENLPEWDDRWQEGGFEENEAMEDWGEPDS